MTYSLEYSSDLNANLWTRLPNLVAVTNSPMWITGLPYQDPVFYRAVQTFVDPPDLKVSLNSNGTQRLTLLGQPNTSYVIQYATSLTGSWTELQRVSFLQNAFTTINVTPPAPGTVFYRVQKL